MCGSDCLVHALSGWNVIAKHPLLCHSKARKGPAHQMLCSPRSWGSEGRLGRGGRSPRRGEGRAVSESRAGTGKGQREALSCCLSRPTLPVLRALSLPQDAFHSDTSVCLFTLERPSLPLKDFEGIYRTQVSLCGGSFFLIACK